MVVIMRAAVDADVAAMGIVHVRAWQAGYRGVMPDAYLDGLDPTDREAMWRELVTAADPERPIVVAEDDGRVVGYASFGPARGADTPTAGELYVLNVDPDVWGRGVGRGLLRTATDGLRAAGFADAVLFVARGNVRARRVYELDGWAHDGTGTTEEVFGVMVDEVRYRRSLALDTGE